MYVCCAVHMIYYNTHPVQYTAQYVARTGTIAYHSAVGNTHVLYTGNTYVLYTNVAML